MNHEQPPVPPGSPTPSTHAPPTSSPNNPFNADAAPVSDDAASPTVSMHFGVQGVVNPSSSDYQLFGTPAHSVQSPVTAVAQGDLIGSTGSSHQTAPSLHRASEGNSYEFSQLHPNQSTMMAPQQSHQSQPPLPDAGATIEVIRNALDQ